MRVVTMVVVRVAAGVMVVARVVVVMVAELPRAPHLAGAKRDHHPTRTPAGPTAPEPRVSPALWTAMAE